MVDRETVSRLFPPYIVVPVTVTVLIPVALALLVPEPVSFDLGTSRWGGLLFVAAGVGLVVWSAWTFAKLGESYSPFEEPGGIVTSGPFSFTRNPMYVSVLLVLVGWAMLLESVLVVAYLVVMAVAFHVNVVRIEEPELREELGEDFVEYCEDVPRWLLF